MRSFSTHKARVAPVVIKRIKKASAHWPLIVILSLTVIGTIGIFALRAQQFTDAIIVVADVHGGFRNGVQVIDPASNAIVAQISVTMPTLAGCASSQPRAYLDDMAVFGANKVVYASVRACAGGNLADGQSLASFDAATGKFRGFMQGVGSGARLYAAPEINRLLVISADGSRLQSVEASSGRVLSQKTFTNDYRVTRWGIGRASAFVVLNARGTVLALDVSSLSQQDIGQFSGMDFSVVPSAPEAQQIEQIGDTFFTVGVAGGRWQLLSMNVSGQATQLEIGAQPVGIRSAPGKEFMLVTTGCPSGAQCVANPNRIYVYNVTKKQFEQSGGAGYIPLQTTLYQLRFNAAATRMYIDGVVSGANGASQRFVYAIGRDGSASELARTAIPGSRWEIATVDFPAMQPVPVAVQPGVVPGGGVGPNTGTIAQAPIPIDEIERLLGMPLSQVDWSKISDDQIRAFGYDPATVRRYVAQWQYTQQSTSLAVPGCPDIKLTPEMQALQQRVGVSLAQIDASQISDDQIRAFGYDPATARPILEQYQKQILAQSTCSANIFTQDSFAATSQQDVQGLPAGAVANPTVQTTFDLLKGGWLMRLRWQAPGGAKRFVIYGRDESKHMKEQKLAIVSGDQREVSFGGFGHLGLPAIWHDERYTLAVVPEKDTAIMGIPAAVKVRVRCMVGWCFTSQ